jgi:hypothetical protein
VSNVAKVMEVNCASSKYLEDAVEGRLSKTVENAHGAWVSDSKVTAAPNGRIT